MENQTAETAAPPAAAVETFAVPSDPAANLEWRKTGKLPDAAKTPKADSTPATETASAEESAETAPGSATGLKQERPKEPSAKDRLNELLADLKRAGFTPAELKTFKREAAKASDTAATDGKPATAAPEKTANPLEAPKKPDRKDFDDWEKYEAARDEYFEQLADFKAAKAVADDRAARAMEAQQQTLKQKLTDARARYGEQTESTIGEATRAILGEASIPVVVRQLLNESPVLVDVMYVLGSEPEELAAFVDLAKSNPGAAIRKLAIMEHLVQEELAKPAASQTSAAPERGEDGKFLPVENKTPAKQKLAAPPPPEELNTRGSVPPDAVEAAARNGDARAYIDAKNRQDIARRRGA